MHLSFAVDLDSHHSDYHHLNKDAVFNVSITRARHRQYVYTSVDKKHLKINTLFSNYLQPPSQIKSKNENTFVDQFANQVVKFLDKIGVKHHWVGFPIAGFEIDILVKVSDRYLGIDLIGYPGEFVDSFSLERYQIFNRAGIQLFPLPYSDWYFNRENTSKQLKAFLN